MNRRRWASVCACLIGIVFCAAAMADSDKRLTPLERLEGAGVTTGAFEISIAWTEAAQFDDVLVHGYRLQPVDGTAAFDLYLDDANRVLSEDDLARLGVVQKRWEGRGAGASYSRLRAESGKASSAPVSAALQHGLRPSAEWALTPLDPLEIEKQQEEAALEKGPDLIGLVRDTGERIRMQRGIPDRGRWQHLPAGRSAWALQVHDPGARGIRLHLTELQLPESARVLVYDAYDPSLRHAVAVRGEEIWTPTLFSDTVVLEVVVDDAHLAGTAFVLAATGHIFEDLEAKAASKQAGACNLDVTCHPDYQDVADAVGWYTYVVGVSLRSCTGALLADANDSQEAYFMTANHCVSNQTTVSSMEVYWFYQTAECNGVPPSLATLPRSDEGAVLLSTSTLSAGTDHSFIRLNGELPEGVAFLGWDGAVAPFGLQTVGVHHPRSSFKRIAFGPVTDCTAQSQYNCPSNVNLSRYYEVTWEDGVTEGGSSGSPVVNAQSRAFLGALWGGFASCSSSIMADYYGRFEVTRPMIAIWLNPSPPVVNILTNSGNNFKTRFTNVNLAGNVSNSATKIEVNGSTDGVTFTPGSTGWSYEGTLTEGPNLIVVTAFVGSVTGQKSITVTLDTNPPVISLNGTNPDFLELGATYVDPGATAEDPEEGPVTVSASGTVANSPAGAQSTRQYQAADSVGNQAFKTRTVIVEPATESAPLVFITTNGGNGSGVDFATAEPELVLEGVVSANAISLTVNGESEGVNHEPGENPWSFEATLVEGPNVFQVLAESSGGQTASKTITITLDTTPPVITLLGNNPDTVFLGEEYVDPGAEAVDDRDGPVAVTVTGEVISSPEGTESVLTYRAEDALGNASETTRTVVAVPDPGAPPLVTITTNGGADFAITDSFVVISGTTTTNTTQIRVNGFTFGVSYNPGSTTWSYDAVLQEGPNVFTVTGISEGGESLPVGITVTRDTTPPVITLLGDNPDTVELGGTYTDPGATAIDAIDGPVSVSVSGFVQNAPLGQQSTLTYTAMDSLGNTAMATRVVVVEPAFSLPPELTLSTNNGGDFATNNPVVAVSGTVSSNATEVRVNGSTTGVTFTPPNTEWTFETSMNEGFNTFEAQAFGPGGESLPASLTVRLDTNPPVITLVGESLMFIPLGGPFNEPGATAFDPEDGVLSVTASGAVATSPLGAESTRVYRTQDAAGNVTEITRTVLVGESGLLTRVRLGSGVAPKNDLLTIPVVLMPSDEPVASLDVTVQYNTSNLRFDRFNKGPAAEFAGATLQATSLGSGLVRLRVTATAQNGGVLVPGVVGRLVLGRGTAGLPTATALSATQAAGMSAEGKALTVQVEEGVAHFIDGTLGPDSDGDGISDVAEVLLGTDPELFDSNGNQYSDGFEIINGSDPTNPEITPIPLPLLGDLNIDARVDSIDVQLVINGALGVRTPMPTDVNGSGGTNATDVQLVINAALGLGA